MQMRVVLVGVACVGKSTIGKLLAEKWSYTFVDFDFELEKRLGDSIERIRNRHFNDHGFRTEVKPVFKAILDENPDNLIIAMPPDRIRQQFNFIINKYHSDVLTVALKDEADNILKRIVFYDEDTNLIEEEVVNDNNRGAYLREIKGDISYHNASYKRAKLIFDIDGMNASDATDALANKIIEYYKTCDEAIIH
jgi:shikimate kinase